MGAGTFCTCDIPVIFVPAGWFGDPQLILCILLLLLSPLFNPTFFSPLFSSLLTTRAVATCIKAASHRVGGGAGLERALGIWDQGKYQPYRKQLGFADLYDNLFGVWDGHHQIEIRLAGGCGGVYFFIY